jgi:hypothetical protein
MQIPGARGADNARQTAQLEIGIEYKLDLKKEDLDVLKELGHGNGGSVSKVRHMATGTVMARKVVTACFSLRSQELTQYRSFTWKQRRKCVEGLFENFKSCTTRIQSIL